MKIKKAIALMLTVLLLASCSSNIEDNSSSGEEGVILRTYTYETKDSEGKSEEFPSTIEVDGQTYEITSFADIDYNNEGSQEMIEFEQEVAVEDLDEIPNKADFEYDGNVYTFNLSETHVKEGNIKKTVKTTADYSNYTFSPKDVPEKTTVTVDLPGGETQEVEGTLVGVEQVSDYEWKDNLVITGVWTGDPSASQFTLDGTSITVPYSAETPTWTNYQNDILSSMGLSSRNYRISSAAWYGDPYTTSAGNFQRYAKYYGSQYVANFLATYACEYETHGWSGNTVYRLKADKIKNAKAEDIVNVYTIKAVVKYKLVENK